MDMRDIYMKAVEVGTEIDWRGPQAVEETLAKARQDSSEPGFDRDRLFNPYGDTRMAAGDPETEVTAMLVGIEIHPFHLVQIAAMRQMGTRIDMALSHHMSCINRGLYYFDDILAIHRCNLTEVGVPAREAEEAVACWQAQIPYGWHMDTVNTARNLGILLMNIHTPCDLFHVRNIRETLARMADATLGGIAAELTETTDEVRLTPYEQYDVIGDPHARPGKVYSPIGAGWTAPLDHLKLACEAGINTAVFVNPGQAHRDMAERYGVNILTVPHNSNDRYGINRMLDQLQTMGPLTIYDAHDFIRFERPA